MPISIVHGKVINTDKLTKSDRILIYSKKFSDISLVTTPAGSNPNLHAESILAGLNICLSHERKNFSLSSKDDVRLDITKQSPQLIDATDKFHGADPSADIGMNTWFTEREELSDNEKMNFIKDRRQKQLSYVLAYNIFNKQSMSIVKTFNRGRNKYTNGHITYLPNPI